MISDGSREQIGQSGSRRTFSSVNDALAAEFNELKVRRDPDCPICSRDPDSISDDEMGVFPDYEAFCAAAG